MSRLFMDLKELFDAATALVEVIDTMRCDPTIAAEVDDEDVELASGCWFGWFGQHVIDRSDYSGAVEWPDLSDAHERLAAILGHRLDNREREEVAVADGTRTVWPELWRACERARAQYAASGDADDYDRFRCALSSWAAAEVGAGLSPRL